MKDGTADSSVAAALAYLSFIPALIFLFREPYRSNRFVRFHSVQCLLCWLVAIVIASLLRLLSLVIFWIPVAGPLLFVVIAAISALAAFLLWIVLIVKSAQGETFKGAIVSQVVPNRVVLNINGKDVRVCHCVIDQEFERMPMVLI